MDNNISVSVRVHLFIGFHPSRGRFTLDVRGLNSVIVSGHNLVNFSISEDSIRYFSLVDTVDEISVVHVEFCSLLHLYDHSFTFNSSGFVGLTLSLELI